MLNPNTEDRWWEKEFDEKFAPQLFNEKEQNEAMSAYVIESERIKKFIAYVESQAVERYKGHKEQIRFIRRARLDDNLDAIGEVFIAQDNIRLGNWCVINDLLKVPNLPNE